MNSPSQPWVVLKFGGTSVATAHNWRMIAGVVEKRRKQGKRVLIVHSAVTGVSNQLERIATTTTRHDFSAVVATIMSVHKDLARDLGVDADVLLKNEYIELHELASGIGLLGEASPKAHARLMALGELMATRLGVAFLNREGIATSWLDARDVLTSVPARHASEASHYTSAQVPFDVDVKAIEKIAACGDVVLTQGFIARNQKGDTVILGRGGSDTSAAYFGAKINAEVVEIWTDVPGMFTANPRTTPGARLLKALDFDEAQEIASTGAKVLHPRCIAPVKHGQIPMWVMCTHQPQLPGTIISQHAPKRAQVKAVSVKKNITLVSMETLGMWQQVGFLADVFACFKQCGLSIDLVSTSESNVTVTLDPSANTISDDVLKQLQRELGDWCKVDVRQAVAAVSVVGRHIREILPQLAPAFSLLAEHDVYLLTQAASDLNLSFVVDNEQADALADKLHSLAIGNEDDVLGPTWQSLQ